MQDASSIASLLKTLEIPAYGLFVIAVLYVTLSFVLKWKEKKSGVVRPPCIDAPIQIRHYASGDEAAQTIRKNNDELIKHTALLERLVASSERQESALQSIARSNNHGPRVL